MIKFESILAGGQTGAQRAALDWAIAHNVPHGGWCPKGRKALDGVLDAKYQLKETEKDVTLERTEWNVRDADATVVFTFAEKATGGALKSVTFARKLKKPCLHLHRGILAGSEKLVAFMDKHRVRRLNIAGSQEEKEPGIYVWVTSTLDKAEGIMMRMGEL